VLRLLAFILVYTEVYLVSNNFASEKARFFLEISNISRLHSY
jgi:hypothetical protein